MTLLIGAVVAAVPTEMDYQGKLTDAGGVGINDTLPMTFRIYSSESGGSALWTETHSGAFEVPVVNGLFDVTLGSINPIDLPFDTDYWLEVVVDVSTLIPRVKLSSSPYAFRANVADSVVGGGGGGGGVVDEVVAGDGLTGGGSGATVTLDVGAGTGINVSADAIAADPTWFTMNYIDEGQTAGGNLTGIYPNPTINGNVVSSIDGVINDFGNIDFVAGANMTITPNDGANTITFDAAGGGGSDTVEVFFPAGGSDNYENYSVKKANNLIRTAVFTFYIPEDFNSLISLTLFAFPSVDVAGPGKDIDLFSQYCSVGESYNMHESSEVLTVYDFTGMADKLIEIDISGVYDFISAGDFCGLRVLHNDIGGDIYYLGILLKYRR